MTPRNEKSNKGTLLVVAAAIFWGTMGTFSRYLNTYSFSAFEVTAVRLTVALIAIASYLLIFKRSLFKIKLKDIWCFLGTGIASLSFFSICYFKSLDYVSISTATVLVYTSPVFIMLMSMILFKERLTRVKFIAIILAIAGSILVSGSTFGGEPIGIVLALLSGFFYALYTIFSKFALMRGYTSLTIVFYTFLFAAVCCAPFANWASLSTVITEPDLKLWLLCLGMGIVTGFIPYLLYSRGLELIESSRASILATLEPVIATLLGLICFGEGLGVPNVVGILLVLSAVVILSIKFKGKNKEN